MRRPALFSTFFSEVRHRLSAPGGGAPEEQWKVSLVQALTVHVVVFGVFFSASYLFQYQPRLPEVYTVNLFTAAEIRRPRVARPRQAPPLKPRKVKKTVPAKKMVPAKKAAPPPPAPVTVKKAVSLRPIRTRTRRDLKRFEQLREAIKAQQAAKEARKAAEESAREALDRLREALRAAGPSPADQSPVQPETANQNRGAADSGLQVDEETRRYLVAVNNQIEDHWVLPDLQNWDESLEAVYVIRVRRDGVVTRTFFERKTDNRLFNQFVEKAVRDASPLPPFPPGFHQSEMEIGLRFRPGGIS